MPTAKQIVPGLHSISLGGVNAFFLDAPEGGILIDTGFPGKADVLLKALAEIGKQPADIRHILLTHTHPDHIGSAAALRRATDAPTYAHPIDAPLVRAGTGWPKLTPAPGLLSKVIVALIHPPMQVEPCPVDHEINDGDHLPLAGGLTVFHTPGHRAGQVCFLWTAPGPDSKTVLFAADACMNEFGLGLTIAYEDLALGKQTLRKLSALDFQVACFGHGKAILKDADTRFRDKFQAG